MSQIPANSISSVGVPEEAPLPPELISVRSRSRFIIPRTEVIVPVLEFILRESGRHDYYVSNGLSWPLLSILTLRGMAGIGKTTIAAEIAAWKAIRTIYDRICFISLGDQIIANCEVRHITYNLYAECMRKLCHQIGAPTDLFHEEIYFLPDDTDLMKAAKNLEAIEQAKTKMARLLNGLKVFLVLDDVWFSESVEIFNFGEEMESSFTLLITTRTLDMFPSTQACWVDIPLLRPHDAVSYFFLESGRGDPLPTDEEFHTATKIVQKCGFLPMAIRIVAKVALITDLDLSVLDKIPSTVITSKQLGRVCGLAAANQKVLNLLHKSFSIVTSADGSHATKICFAVMAVVFNLNDNIRPWVSQDTVEMLWNKIFETSDDIRLLLPKLPDYQTNPGKEIMNLLHILGLIDKRTRKEGKQINEKNQVRIHHDLLWEYGKMVANMFNRAERDSNSYQAFDPADLSSSINLSDLEDKVKLWNSLMVDCYQENLDMMDSNSFIFADSHMLYWLPYHMIKSERFKEVFELLLSKNFLNARINFLGTLEGTKEYVLDIQKIQRKELSIEKGGNRLNQCEKNSNKTKLVAVVFLIGRYLSNLDQPSLPREARVEIGHSLILLGVAEQSLTLWQESLECFQKALNIFQKIGCERGHPYVVNSTCHINSCITKPILLVSENSQHCIQLKYAKNFNEHDYGPSGLPLELSSHPGKGIVRIERITQFSGLPFVGMGPKELSVLAVKERNMLLCMNHREILRCYSSVAEGMPAVWSSVKEKERGEWIIRSDGKVSPVQNPHLCLAASPYTLFVLVSRHAANRAIFRNAAELKKSQEMTSSKNRIPLTLMSHPNHGIVEMVESSVCDVAFVTVSVLYIGPEKDSLSVKFTEHGEILFEIHGGLVLRVFQNILEAGNFLCATRDNCDCPRRGEQFQVNDDGSISLVEAPHLALGFSEKATSDNLLSTEMRLEAERVASKSFNVSSSRKDINKKYQKYFLKNFTQM